VCERGGVNAHKQRNRGSKKTNDDEKTKLAKAYRVLHLKRFRRIGMLCSSALDEMLRKEKKEWPV
jgi:hypothetical protein